MKNHRPFIFSILACVCFLLILIPKTRAQTLMSHVSVVVTQQNYSYTIFNDEPLDSANYDTSFSLFFPPNTVQFAITDTPTGWIGSTDGSSFVTWSNNDTSLPYPHDIAPGSSLNGFSILATVPSSPENVTSSINAWDHATDSPGPILLDNALAPHSTAAVPEASSLISFGVGLLFIACIYLIAHKRAKKTI